MCVQISVRKNIPRQSTGHFTVPSPVVQITNKKEMRGEKSTTIRLKPNKCRGTAAADSSSQ